MSDYQQDDDGFFTTAPELMEALSHVPPGTKLRKNLVGNLSVHRDGAFVGYVDVHRARYVSAEIVAGTPEKLPTKKPGGDHTDPYWQSS
jgi:hypothetical protein